MQENVEKDTSKKKKKIIIIGAIIMMVLLIGGLTIYFLTREPKETRELIKKVNQINANLVDKNLSKEGMYTVGEKDNLRTCYRYVGENKDELIKMIANTYYIYGLEGDIFNVSQTETGQSLLYICLTDNCKYKEIKKYKTVNDENLKKEKVIFNDQYEVYIHEKDGKKQFRVPVDMCKIN